MNETHDETSRGNGKDDEPATAHGLAPGAAAIGVALIRKSAETLQQIVDVGRDTAERALEAAGSAVEGAGRFGERTTVSLSEAISPLSGSRAAQRSNGAITASAA